MASCRRRLGGRGLVGGDVATPAPTSTDLRLPHSDTRHVLAITERPYMEVPLLSGCPRKLILRIFLSRSRARFHTYSSALTP